MLYLDNGHYTDKGIKPAAAEVGTTHKVMMFNVLKSSVRAYARNLNTHKSYRKMRYVRAIQRDNIGKLNSIRTCKSFGSICRNR